MTYNTLLCATKVVFKYLQTLLSGYKRLCFCGTVLQFNSYPLDHILELDELNIGYYAGCRLKWLSNLFIYF